jgi:hypothetical protein
MNNRRWFAKRDCLGLLGRCLVELSFLLDYRYRITWSQTVPRVSLDSPALGYDFERVTVHVQRLVEALREGHATCPRDIDPISLSQRVITERRSYEYSDCR